MTLFGGRVGGCTNRTLDIKGGCTRWSSVTLHFIKAVALLYFGNSDHLGTTILSNLRLALLSDSDQNYYLAGKELVHWLRVKLLTPTEAEALHLANALCRLGYIVPVNDRQTSVKFDNSCYRIQVIFHSNMTTWYQVRLGPPGTR